MARGRPKLDPEVKRQRKEAKEAAQASALAANALAKLPAEKDSRDELFREAEALKSEAQAVAGQIAQHKKRMREVYGITKQADRIRAILLSCPDGVYEATLEQVALFIRDAGRPFQLPLDLQPGKGVADHDDAPMFDATASGERQASEAAGDPGKARKPRAQKGAPPAPTGSLTPEEAKAAFQANAHKAPQAAGGGDEEDPRPRFLKENERQRLEDPFPGATAQAARPLAH